MASRDGLKQTGQTGVFYKEHETRKHGVKYDRQWVIRQTLGGKTRLSVLGWISEGVLLGDAINKVAEYKANHDWNKVNSDKPPKPVCKADEDEAKRLAAEEIMRRKALEKELNLTFSEYFESHYLPYHEGESKKSLLRERGIYVNHLKPVIGHFTFAEITHFHLEKIKSEAIKNGLSKRSANYHLDLVRQVWNRAIIDEKTDKTPPNRKVKKYKLNNKRDRFLTKAEEDFLLPALMTASLREHDMVLLSLDTGARWSEVAELRWENVQLGDEMLRFPDTKPGNTRPGYMTSRVKEMLLRRKHLSDNMYVFPNRDGGALKYQSNTFARVVEKLKLNDEVTDKRLRISFHSCRHTFAFRLVSAGVDLYVVKELMGHSSIAVTERYAHLKPERKRAAVEILEQQDRFESPADIVSINHWIQKI